jgi:DNA-binding CsgD family transcriptional regulator/dipeptidyl aminopeptidase/acylaminoacyl peptidase
MAMSVEREQPGARAHPEWTPRQREVLDLLARGYTNPQIAVALGVTLDGAKWHVREVLTKLGASNREEAAEWWRQERSLRARVVKPLRGLAVLTASRGVLLVLGAVAVGVVVVVAVAGLRGGDEPAGPTANVSESPPTATAPGQGGANPTPDASFAGIPGGGSKVAWVAGGRIWAKTINGSAVLVTPAATDDAEPKWSLSGKWLAFRRGNAVWVIGESTPPTALVDVGVGGFEWSPVGDVLALTTAAGRLLVWDPASGASRELARKTFFGSFAWSPDARQIAFAEMPVPGPTDGGQPSPGRLVVVDVGSGQATELARKEPGQGWFIIAGWAGDGTAVLFWDNAAASASIAAGGLPLKSIDVASRRVSALADAHIYRDFVGSAGARVAVIGEDGDASFRETWVGQALMLGGAGSVTAVTPRDESVSSVAWSPDGTKLAYDSMPALLGVTGSEPARVGMMARRIWVMDASTKAKKRLTDDSAYRDEYPRWSADGQSIVFLRIDNDSQASIWTVPANGGTPTMIASGVALSDGWFGYYGHVEWPAVFDYWPG